MTRAGAVAVATALALAACAGPKPDAERYRLAHSGTHWDVVADDRVLDDVAPRYPEFFAILLDPASGHELPLRAVRDDLERRPPDRRNYDALNAVAIAYFELNYRAEARRGGPTYLRDSHRTTQLVAVPWRAYGLVDASPLRDAILDFFEDASSGEKLGSYTTRGRLLAVVASLARKESDVARLARIDAIVRRLGEGMPR